MDQGITIIGDRTHQDNDYHKHAFHRVILPTIFTLFAVNSVVFLLMVASLSIGCHSAIQLTSLSWFVGMDSRRCTTCAAFARSQSLVAEVDT